MKVKCIVNATDSNSEDFIVVENDISHYRSVVITLCGGNSPDKTISVDGSELTKAIANAMNT